MTEPAEQPAMTASGEADTAAMTTPPAPEPAMTPVPSSFDVYFASKSWLMGDLEESTIDDAVAAAQAQGSSTFVVDGYADGAGSERQNMRFSKLRAEAVADALIARGVAPGAIQVSWHGAEAPAAEPPSRKVTIALQ